MEDFTITHIGDTALSLPMPFKYIPAKGKTFMFQADDGSNWGSYGVGVPIIFENDYWLCAYPTTQELWTSIVISAEHQTLKTLPSRFGGKNRPVEKVSWNDVELFNLAMNDLKNKKRIVFSNNFKSDGSFGLPSEIQWEYASLAGSNLLYSGSQSLDDVGWYIGNCNNQTMPVGLKQPNSFGLYDMSGNVWEWCADDFTHKLEEFPKKGGPNLKIDKYKSLRGGGYLENIEFCRTRFRGSNLSKNLIANGFRLSFIKTSSFLLV